MMSTREEFVEGGLFVYAASTVDLARRAATYVDKILKGVKPAELPVEQPTKFELVINLKTAKQVGLTIPPTFWRGQTELSSDCCYRSRVSRRLDSHRQVAAPLPHEKVD
jgi:ABC-type uncharacterized transport system substrate-binding protein